MLTILGYTALAILGGLFLCFMVPSVIRMSRRSTAVQKRAKEVMRNRRSLSAEAFALEFFPQNQSATAARLRQMLENIVIVDASRIHPDDQLIEDLGFGQVNGLDPNFLELDVEREFGVNLKSAWSSLKTVRDLVTYISEVRSQRSDC
jgi:acyl carrier protein